MFLQFRLLRFGKGKRTSVHLQQVFYPSFDRVRRPVDYLKKQSIYWSLIPGLETFVSCAMSWSVRQFYVLRIWKFTDNTFRLLKHALPLLLLHLPGWMMQKEICFTP